MPTIPSWIKNLAAPVGVFLLALWTIAANNWNQRRKGAAEKEAEIESATNKLIIKNTKRAKEIDEESESKTKAELIANGKRNGWL